jgi:hypothetical protein
MIVVSVVDCEADSEKKFLNARPRSPHDRATGLLRVKGARRLAVGPR